MGKSILWLAQNLEYKTNEPTTTNFRATGKYQTKIDCAVPVNATQHNNPLPPQPLPSQTYIISPWPDHDLLYTITEENAIMLISL